MNFQLKGDGFKVYKIDEQKWLEQPHSHSDMYQISVPVSGTLRIGLDTEVRNISPGQLIVTHPTVQHWHQTGAEPSSFLLLGIEKELFQTVDQKPVCFETGIEFNVVHQIDLQGFQRFLFQKVVHELWSSSGDRLKLEEVKVQLSKYLLSLLKGIPVSDTFSWQHREEIIRVQEYIKEMYAEPLQLEDLCKLANMSKFHLIRLFRKQTGKTPYQYLQEIRLEKAMVLLSKTNKTVTEIAGLVGLSHNGLQKLFRDKLRSTPLNFRKGS